VFLQSLKRNVHLGLSYNPAWRRKAGGDRETVGVRREVPESSLSALLGIRFEFGSSGRAYIAYPNLRKARWLFPAHHPVIRRAGINGLSEPGSLRGKVLKKLIEAGAVRGERVQLEETGLAKLEAELARVLGERIHVAFYVGVPGAYRKVMAQVLTPTGKTLAYAKMGTSPMTQAAVQAERQILLRLSKGGALHGKVPEVLGWFSWQGGEVLLITSGPKHPGPRQLSNMHSEFYESLYFSSAKESVFGESRMWNRMVETSLRLNAGLADPLPTYYSRALEQLNKGLSPVLLPLSLAHRDFAPWNTRLGPQGLFVFDWEIAEDKVTPLYDIFHFQSIQAALFKRRERLPDRRYLEALMRNLWPEGKDYMPWFYLAYLVDMSLVYSEAQIIAPGVGEQRVWRWFMEQIKNFLEEGSPL
jgi:hypothetical protein